MFRKFLTNPTAWLALVVVGSLPWQPILSSPLSVDNGIRFVQATVGDKSQLVRVNANAKVVHYHGNLRWDDTRRETYAIYEKAGKLTTFAMYADRPWTFRDPTADEVALWRSFFNT